jgi:hypothetical protein
MRPQMPAPLSLEEHAELGRELRRTRVRLHELYSVVAEVYGPHSRSVFSFQKVTEAVDRLVGDLEAQAASDHPGQTIAGIYL